MRMSYETDRLLLKILQEDSASRVLEFYHDNRDVFEPYEPDRPKHFYSRRFQAAVLKNEFALIANASFVRFYLFEKEAPSRIIGSVSFHDIKYQFYQSCQIGYKLHRDFWHRGYAAEGIRKCISILFDEFGLHRIEALVVPDNAPSIRLLEGLGFQKEGISRSCLYFRGKWRDHVRYSLIASNQ